MTAQEICDLYCGGKGLGYLMKIANHSFETINRILEEGGVEKRIFHKLTNEQKDQIVIEYQEGMSADKLAEKYGVCKTNVNNLLRRRCGLRTGPETMRMTFPVNEHAFDIFTEESAYWIGMLMADGCITNSHYVTLALTEKDLGHVEKFKQFLGCVNHKITRVSRVKGGYNVSFAVASKALTNKLAEYGVTQKKLYTAKPSKELLFNRNFWRGMVDGDGYISIRNKYPIISLVGSKFICEDFANYVKHLTNSKANVYPTKSIWGFSTSGRFASIIVQELYSDCDVFLERKMPIVKEIMNWKSVCFPIHSKLSATSG